MTAPVYVCDDLSDAEEGSTLVLDGAEAHHAATVRRARAGERIDVVDGRGTRARCVVAEAGRARLALDVRERVREQAPRPRITLVQALAKAGRDLQAVETSTEYGASRFVPWAADRSIAAWKGKEDRGRARWEATALAAAKQSRRSWIPEVTPMLGTDGVVALAVREGATLLVCHEEAREGLPGARAENLWIVVGPEGGIADRELEAFREAGGRPVLLSSNVLRSASAGPFAMAALSGMRLVAG